MGPSKCDLAWHLLSSRVKAKVLLQETKKYRSIRKLEVDFLGNFLM